MNTKIRINYLMWASVFLLCLLAYGCRPSKVEESVDIVDSDSVIEDTLLETVEGDKASDEFTKYISNKSSILAEAMKRFDYNKSDYFLIIDTTFQKMFLIQDGEWAGDFIISTAKNGEGSVAGSLKTPLGYHKIVEKIGNGAKVGEIFVGKRSTGEISPIYTDKTDIENDPVVTRIMSLTGLEDGKNRGGNVDSYKRAIYIHGTHEEGLLGTKTSHGCIRMYNSDVIALFDLLPNNTLVYITQ